MVPFGPWRDGHGGILCQMRLIGALIPEGKAFPVCCLEGGSLRTTLM